MIFVKSFKGYEDKLAQLDAQVNAWIAEGGVKVVDVKTVLGHEHQARAASGDLVYTVLYEADAPLG